MLKNNYQVSSLDDVVENSSDGSSVARIESVGEVEQGYEETERRLVLKDIFNVLNDTEKSVIHYIFGENLNQKRYRGTVRYFTNARFSY